MSTRKNPRAVGSAGAEMTTFTTASIPLRAPESAAFDTSEVNHDPDLWFQDCALSAIAQLARSGVPFTTDDLRDLGVPEPDRPTRWGVVMQAAYRAGMIRPIAATNSRRPSRHSGLQRVWEGVPSAEGVSE